MAEPAENADTSLPDLMYRYPAQIDSIEAIPGYVLFNIFQRKSVKESTPYKKIALYMPEDASMPNTVSWESAPGGIILDALAAITGSGQGPGLADAAGALTENFKNAAATTFLKQMGSTMDGATAGGIVSKTIANPYLQMAFKGVDLRTFKMSFKFYPHSASDCERIDKIIKLFREISLPSGAGFGGKGMLGYPGEIDIIYMWKDGINKWLHKFRRCVITELDVNYTQAGQWSVMNNGFPAETLLNLTFREMQIVVSEDVEQGF